MRKQALVFIWLFVGFVGASPAFAQDYRDAVSKPVLWGDELYTETYTMILDLTAGTYMQLQFVVSNAGPGDGHGACRALVIESGAEPWTLSKKVKRSQWRYSRAESSILDIKHCFLSAGEKIEAEMSLDGAHIKVRLDNLMTGFKPPYGDISIAKDKHYKGEVLVSRADAEVAFNRKGKRAKVLQGVGYLDHSIGNVLPKKVAQSWLRLRSLHAACPFLAQLQVHPAHTKAVGWSWSGAENKAVLVDKIEPLWQAQEELQGFRLNFLKPLSVEIVDKIYRFVPMQEYGLLGRLVGSVVGSPVTSTYRVRLRGLEACPVTNAIMEVAFSDS
ncbi:MAG: hypothetical protein QGI45_01695 [Myxococcota bacterium]|jgi:hypothetical protein|nr:hypothetical protein [Myxococcota bacterium]